MNCLRPLTELSRRTVVFCVAVFFAPVFAFGQNSMSLTVHTESPRATFESLTNLGTEIANRFQKYSETRNRADFSTLKILIASAADAFDLSEVPPTLRAHIGAQSVVTTLDLITQLPEIDPQSLPVQEELPNSGSYSYQIDGTPLRFHRVVDGERQGEVLFDGRTALRVARFTFLDEVRAVPEQAPANVSLAQGLQEMTSPAVPLWVPQVFSFVPGDKIFDTLTWKAAFGLCVALLAAGLAWAIGRALRKITKLPPSWRNAFRPVLLIVFSLVVTWYLNTELQLTGRLAIAVEAVNIFNLHAGAAWLIWIAVHGVFSRGITRYSDQSSSIDVHLMRLVGQILAAFAALTVGIMGAQALGLPVLSILAGFGLGGLAIALAIRPTFENLIGGFILYLDRPVRVGDFCSFGDQFGTVEKIGIRSTQIRALDRTIISVPNAQFADMSLINWAACDMMQIKGTLGLRYETKMDTLRLALAEIRKMLHAHPRIDNETIRVRFAGFGDYALLIDLRVCALTREWNDFFAIREDVFFRISEVIRSAGADFAFPSQTLYLGRDGAQDPQKAETARHRMDELRRSGRFPFPRFKSEDLAILDGTLAYPPPGSPDYLNTHDDLFEGAEKLSQEELDEDEELEEPERKE